MECVQALHQAGRINDLLPVYKTIGMSLDMLFACNRKPVIKFRVERKQVV